MSSALLILLCLLPQAEISEAERLYRALETKLTGSIGIRVEYRREAPGDRDFGFHAKGAFELSAATSPGFSMWDRYQYRTTDGYGSGGPSTTRDGFMSLQGKALSEYLGKALLAGGMFEILRIYQTQRDHPEPPAFSAGEFKLVEEKDARVLEFKVARSTVTLTRRASVRIWLHRKTGWPVRRTYQEEGLGEERLVTEHYDKFTVEGVPVETETAGQGAKRESSPAADPLPPPPPEFARRVTFPAADDVKALAAKNDRYAAILEQLLEPSHWSESARAIEALLGPFPGDVTVRVRLVEADGEVCAETSRDPGDRRIAIVEINLKAIAKAEKLKEEFLERNEDLKRKKRPLLEWENPPPALDKYVPHELVHVSQVGIDTPDWFNEGLPAWAAGDPSFRTGFLNRSKSIEDIDVTPAAKDGKYGRGHLFFMWLEQHHGRGIFPKLVDAVYGERLEVPEALSNLLGRKWEEIKKDELKWSRRYAAQRKAK